MSLPLCDLTEIPRLLCHHCESFTMTEPERLYLAGWEVYAPATSTLGAPLPSTDYVARGYGIPAEVKAANTDVQCAVGCGRTRDESVFVCAQCIENVEVALGDVPALMADLLILTMKQARFTASGKGTDRSPLPFSPHAADAAAHLGNEVMTAIRMLCDHRGIPHPYLLNAEEGSRWLLSNAHAIAVDEAGPDIVTGILREHRRAMRTIDRPPEAQYIGLCDTCKTPMHAREGEPEHRCGTCGAEWEVAAQKAKIGAKVQGALLSLRELADLSERYLGGKVTVKQLEGMVRRKRLTSAGARRDADRVTQLYRAADVVAIMGERAS